MVDKIVGVILDFRLLLLLAVLVGSVAAIHVNGPFELQAPVDQIIVRPIMQSTTALADLLHIGTRPADPEKSAIKGSDDSR